MTSLAKRLARAPAPVLLGVLVLLLAVLATLQYRWAGELVEAERVRMQASAKARAEAMGRDLDREITRTVFRLQLDGSALAERDFTSFAERLEGWRRQAAYPDVVKEVFLVEREEGAGLRLSRFDPRLRSFVAAEWPAPLAGLRARIAETTEPFSPERAWRHGPFDIIVDAVPALLIPVRGGDREPPRGPGPGPRPGEGPPPFRRAQAMTMVVLDGEVLRARVFPALAERHFGGDYDLAVVREEDPRAVVWQSRPTAGPVGLGDATAGLLGLRLEEVGEQDIALPPPRDSRRAPDGGSGGGFIRRFAGRAGGPGGPPRIEHAGHWRLVATHASGSIDTVVSGARRRNLAISFGILVLLGTSAALLVSAARRAERLGRQQMEFVAGVSHELRTPLAVIRSAGENLADGVVREPAQVRSYGALVRDEGRRLSDMVEEVLELAGADSRALSASRTPLEVAPLLEAALAACEPALRAGGITAEKDVPPGLPRVMGDEGALRRVLRNLIENAIKYGGEARWIGLRAGTAAGKHGREVWVSVADRGLGIPAEEARHIFEPFYRGQEATARQIHGSGLGLSLVRRIVESHGGAVSVERSGERGSVFTLRLPAAAGEAAS